MRNRGLMAVACTVALAAAALVVVSGQGQPADPGAKAPTTAWTPTRTPDGQPDLQGIWTNFTATPFEVPLPTATPEVYAGNLDGQGRDTGPGAFLNDMTGRELTKQRSLVVDPPNGRVPIMPWAEERRNYKLAHIRDSWEHHTAWERCITRGVPGGLFPAGYGSGYQILQGPGYVAIIYEMIHEARIIPLDGRPAQPPHVKSYMGESRGHFEGATLVVRTTHLNGRTGMQGNGMMLMPSDALELVERFTPVSAAVLHYEVTVNDPKTWAQPWKVAFPLKRESDYQIFEYACHEGNNAMRNILSGSRADERAAAVPGR